MKDVNLQELEDYEKNVNYGSINIKESLETILNNSNKPNKRSQIDYCNKCSILIVVILWILLLISIIIILTAN